MCGVKDANGWSSNQERDGRFRECSERVSRYLVRDAKRSILKFTDSHQETNKTPDGSLGAVGWRRWSSRFGGDASRFLLRPGAAAAAHQIYCGADLR